MSFSRARRYILRISSSYAMNIDALYESERIKNEMFDFEQSLWEY